MAAGHGRAGTGRPIKVCQHKSVRIPAHLAVIPNVVRNLKTLS